MPAYRWRNSHSCRDTSQSSLILQLPNCSRRLQPDGFSTFQLILNVPYLVLEEALDTSSGSATPLDSRMKKKWADLSYLPLESETGQQSDRFAIYESQTTVVISGCDHSKWFGYAFGKIGPDDPTPDEDDSADIEQDDLEPKPVEDLFATGGSEAVLSLQNPIWDPRVYFPCAARIRLDIATQAYEYLVRTIDAGAMDWVG